MAADITDIGIANKRGTGGVIDICEKALQLAKSGRLKAVVIVGELDNGDRFHGKVFDAADSSSMIGGVAIMLAALCGGQLDEDQW